MEAMRFGGAPQRILKQVLTADPRLGPVYLNKLDLADAYMRLGVGMEDFPSVMILVMILAQDNRPEREGRHAPVRTGRQSQSGRRRRRPNC